MNYQNFGQKKTRRYLLRYRRILKKGDFNTPTMFYFLKRKTAALIVFSNRRCFVGASSYRHATVLLVAISQQSFSRNSYLKRKAPTITSFILVDYRLCVCAAGSFGVSFRMPLLRIDCYIALHKIHSWQLVCRVYLVRQLCLHALQGLGLHHEW